jgi:hypothetical protein
MRVNVALVLCMDCLLRRRSSRNCQEAAPSCTHQNTLLSIPNSGSARVLSPRSPKRPWPAEILSIILTALGLVKRGKWVGQ